MNRPRILLTPRELTMTIREFIAHILGVSAPALTDSKATHPAGDCQRRRERRCRAVGKGGER